MPPADQGDAIARMWVPYQHLLLVLGENGQWHQHSAIGVARARRDVSGASSASRRADEYHLFSGHSVFQQRSWREQRSSL